MGMNLDEISKLLGEITPLNQWNYDGSDNANASLTIGVMDCDLSRMSRYTHELVASREEMEANARLIAAAPTIIKELVERVRKLEEALTPSVETKAAYISEFFVKYPEWDESGNDRMRQICVPWTVIKQIMKAIRDRANAKEST